MTKTQSTRVKAPTKNTPVIDACRENISTDADDAEAPNPHGRVTVKGSEIQGNKCAILHEPTKLLTSEC